MRRYQELIQASATVVTAMDAIMNAERLSPAWYKACRIKHYLDKQAAHVMEGRTEDGVESSSPVGKSVNALEAEIKEASAIFGGAR